MSTLFIHNHLYHRVLIRFGITFSMSRPRIGGVQRSQIQSLQGLAAALSNSVRAPMTNLLVQTKREVTCHEFDEAATGAYLR